MSDTGNVAAGIEAEIEALEQREASAELRGDIAELERLWSEDLLANSTSKIIAGKETLLNLIRAGRLRLLRFERRTVRCVKQEDLAIATGNETSEIAIDPPVGTFFCSYMNIWKRQNGQWKLLGRHVGLISRSDQPS